MNRLKLLLATILAAAVLFCGPLGCVATPLADEPAFAQNAFDSTVLALEVLDGLEAERIRLVENPTADDVAFAQLHVGRLRAVRDVLEKVRNAGVERSTYADLALAVSLLRDAAKALVNEGVRVPPETEQVLTFIETWLAAQKASTS